MGEFRWLFRARIPDVRDVPEPVHDGDTIRLQLDRGASVYTVDTLRLRNVFAPELKQPGGMESREFVESWLLKQWVAGGKWPFVVETFKTAGGRDLETLDRYVATVTGDPTQTSLNNEINMFLMKHPEWGGGTGA